MTAFRTTTLLSLGLIAAVLWHFHDQFWWPVDEGVYAYVAQRMLAGDRLHLDIIDLHAGYGNLINAWAFQLFGEDLLSLRYPLVLATLAQSAVVLILLRDKGAAVAAIASIAVACFSFIQFMNPSANWYALALFFVTVWALCGSDPRRWRDLVIVGALVGLCFFTRQLSGIILAMGVVTWLLLSLPSALESRGIAGRVLLAIIAIGLLGYLSTKSSLIALIGFGAWPFAIIAIGLMRMQAAEKDVMRLVGGLTLGGLLAAAPLIVHHAMHGALGAWVYDMFVTALLIQNQEFITSASFGTLFNISLMTLLNFDSPVAALNGLFWVLTLAVVPLSGALTVHHVWKGERDIHPLPVIAAFYALIAVHYQIPVYLVFAIPASFAALLWLMPRAPVTGVVAMMSAVAVVFHAGQPLSRGYLGIVEGHRVAQPLRSDLPRVSLRIESADQTLYRSLLARISATARPDEPLMTLPMNPELNFIAGRPTPMRYYGTPLGLISQDDVKQSIATLKAAAPLFIVHRREDKYLTPLSADLLSEIRALSPQPERIGQFDLYRLPGSIAQRDR